MWRSIVAAMVISAAMTGCASNGPVHGEPASPGEMKAHAGFGLGLLKSDPANAPHDLRLGVMNADLAAPLDVVHAMWHALASDGWSVGGDLDCDVLILLRATPPRYSRTPKAGDYVRVTSLVPEDTLLRLPPDWRCSPMLAWRAVVFVDFNFGDFDGNSELTLRQISVNVQSLGRTPALDQREIETLWNAIERWAAPSRKK